MRRAAALLVLVPLLTLACSKKKGVPGSGTGGGEDVRAAKASEAKVNLMVIAKGVKTMWATDNALPASIPMTPALGACCQAPDRKCPAEPQLFDAAGWGKVDFAPSDPHYYSYELVSSPTEVTVRAKGDLDCNGTYSTYESHFKVEAGELSGGELSIDNPLE